MSTLSPAKLRALAVSLAIIASLVGCTGKEETNAPLPTQAPTPTPTATTSAPKPKPKPPKTSEKPKEPTTDPLTGGKKSVKEVFAVKIDNVAAARPQVSVGRADIVVVEQVESRLTRLIAIYHTDFPKRVGPVRSARNSDLRLLPMFGKPGLVFSGANRKVYRQIRKASVVELERSPRDRSRIAPHNVIVDLEQLAKSEKVGQAQQLGFAFADKDARWDKAQKDDKVSVKVGVDTTSFNYSGGRYAVSWNGLANTDGDSGKTVKTDNVIVLSVKNYKDSDTTSSQSVVSETVGKGKVTIHRDGKTLTGTWSRAKLSGPMTFTDSSGKDIPLKPGKSWVLLKG